MKTAKIPSVPPLPAGFRGDAGGDTGLILPEALSRVREVITKEQYKKLSVAIRDVLGEWNAQFLLLCNLPKCPEKHMKRHRTADGFILRCGHRDLVWSRTFEAQKDTRPRQRRR